MADVPLPASPTGSEVDIVEQTLTQLSTDVGNSALDGSNNVKTEQQSPVAVEDSAGSQVDPLDTSEMSATSATTTSTGSANAATVVLGDHRTSVSVGWTVSGAAQIDIEGSNDGSTWHPIDQYNPGSGETSGTSLTVGWEQVRVYADANLTEAAISGKGV